MSGGDGIDGFLEGGGVVGDAVGVDREVVTGEIDGGGIVELCGVVGRGGTEGEREPANNRMPRQRAFFTIASFEEDFV